MTDRINMRQAWNRITPHYQAEHRIPTDFVHYGPHCPNEDELQLIGDVRAKRVLEIGCGGGQCSVAFAKRGAIAMGIDLSDEQVKFARALAKESGVAAEFHRGNVEKLSRVPDASQHLVFSAYALQYLQRLDRCFAEVARVLRPGGLFVFSLDHPFWYCLAEDELRIESSYFDAEYSYQWGGQRGLQRPPRVTQYQRTVGDYFRLLRSAGLEVLDIIEPEPVESGSGEDWREYYAPERQRMVPATIIWKARKPKAARRR
jgi:ubiquinone/menaquinone biosynthesis C-methylase UbiE